MNKVNLAVVAWFVSAFSNNTYHLRKVVPIPVGGNCIDSHLIAMKISKCCVESLQWSPLDCDMTLIYMSEKFRLWDPMITSRQAAGTMYYMHWGTHRSWMHYMETALRGTTGNLIATVTDDMKYRLQMEVKKDVLLKRTNIKKNWINFVVSPKNIKCFLKGLLSITNWFHIFLWYVSKKITL